MDIQAIPDLYDFHRDVLRSSRPATASRAYNVYCDAFGTHEMMHITAVWWTDAFTAVHGRVAAFRLLTGKVPV